jgi:hypothetical protein
VPALTLKDDLGMGRFIRPPLALVLALFMRPGPASGPAATYAPSEPWGDAHWYAPLAEDFRPHYDHDVANRGKQTWEQYWGWVKSFYQGSFLAKGWSDRAAWLVEGVRSERERKRLQTKINSLGRDICAEWAKDYDLRKLGSADLLTWGKMLEKARARDDGNGAELHRTIETIRSDHRRKVASEPIK